MKSTTTAALTLLSTSFLSLSAGRLLVRRGESDGGSFSCTHRAWRGLFSREGMLYVLGQALTILSLGLAAAGALLLLP